DLRISTHALREEGDRSLTESRVAWPKIFLPTPSARRATRTKAETQATYTDFYPRPPRGGRRGVAETVQFVDSDFYPRPPRGGRLVGALTVYFFVQFLP